MYDHPQVLPSSFAPSSSSSSSSPMSATKMTRSNSPIPHISTLLPHHHHAHHHSQYSPNSRQSDISRLLDPSYASQNSSSSGSSQRSASQSAQTRAYVDHHGDLHDPDYRDFPVLPARAPKANAPRRRHTANSAQLLSHHHSTSRLGSTSNKDRYSTYPLVARPEWERDWATEIEDLEEDDEDVLDLGSTKFTRAASVHTTPSSRRASLPPSIYAHSTFFYTEPVSLASSPADSLEEPQQQQSQQQQQTVASSGLSSSPFEDLAGAEELMEVEETASTSKRRAASLLRRMKRNSSQASVPISESPAAAPQPAYTFEQETKEVIEEPEYEYSQSQDQDEDEEEARERARMAMRMREIELDEDTVPTCAFVFRRQLRAVTLRLRFGMFHVRRRLAKPRRKTI